MLDPDSGVERAFYQLVCLHICRTLQGVDQKTFCENNFGLKPERKDKTIHLIHALKGAARK